MFIELVDALRCVRPHEDSWLVGAFERVEERDVREGRLGCPVCRAEYPIRDGIAHFEAGAPRPTPRAVAGPDVAGNAAMRVAALLALEDPGGLVVLAGEWGRQAEPLLALADQIRILLVNPAVRASSGGGISIVTTDDALPLAAGAARGIALDGSTASRAMLEGAARALRGRGRLVAPAAAPVPAGVTELARDDTLWVGERAAATTPPQGLQRRRPPST
jgi:hypothetical protein